MEVISKHFLVTLTFLFLVSHVHSIRGSKTSSDFIKKSCNTTTYPSLCLQSLNPYAASVGTNAPKLCNASLAISIKTTSNCWTTVSKLSKRKGVGQPEVRAIKECIGDMKDAIYELKQTVNAMGHLGDTNREFQWANAKTYASAAMTDAETCIDGFLGRNVNLGVKKKIKSCVSRVEQLISNALSLINHLY